MLENLRLKVSEVIDIVKLKHKENKELREIHKEDKFKKDMMKLEMEIEKEEKRAELRGLKTVNRETRNGSAQGLGGFKSAFGKFQDFADDFTKRQQSQERRSSLLEPTIKINTPGGKSNARTYKI